MTSTQLMAAFALAPPALQAALRAASVRDPRRQLVEAMVEEAQIRRLELAQRRRAATAAARAAALAC